MQTESFQSTANSAPGAVTKAFQKPKRRCQFCGQIAELIWVHGHGQCAACGINAEECCRGEQCNPSQTP